jgi:hypothetical protein
MRRLFLLLALATVTAAALTTAAFAKEGGVELSSTPYGTPPGDSWSGTLTVFTPDGSGAASNPSITIRNLETGETQTFPTKPAKVPTTAHEQSFVFDVVFPTAGRYRYTVSDGVSDREYEFPIVQIVDPAPASLPGPGSPSDEAFPVWPVVGGLGGAAALALAAFLAIRTRRFAH